MKKTLLTVLFTLTLVCLFAFGASAYENDYFSMDIPSDYVVSEEDGMVTAQKSGVVITVTYGDAMGDTFANLTEAQKIGYDDIIKDSYKEYGTIENYTSDFAGNDSASAMTFAFTISGGTLDGAVEGIMLIEDDFLYHAVFIVSDESLYNEAIAISETFMPKTKSFEELAPEGDTSDAGNTIGAVSDGYYETEYYTIKMPDSFSLSSDSTDKRSTWTSADASALMIDVSENIVGAKYADLSENELKALENTVKATYENLGVAKFDSLSCENATLNGIPCVNYKVECTLYSAALSVNGYLITNDDYIYTLEAACRNTEDAADIDAALDTLALEGEFDLPESGDDITEEPEDNKSESDGKIKYESEDKLVSFSVPADYVEAVAAGDIEKQWVSADKKFSVAYATMANEDFGSLKGLSKTELEQIGASFAEGLGDDSVSDVVATSVTVNGYEGVKITSNIKVFGIDADLEVYGFTTKETAMFIYFYCYDGVDSQAINAVLDTLRIDAELYEKPGADSALFVVIAGGALIAIIVIAVISKSKKNKKKAAYAQQYQAPFSPYPQNGNQQNFGGYPAPNQYGQQPQNNFPQNQGMNGSYNQNNNNF